MNLCGNKAYVFLTSHSVEESREVKGHLSWWLLQDPETHQAQLHSPYKDPAPFHLIPAPSTH